LSPEVAAITRIGLEHSEYLGSTIPSIAREKAGIVKEGISVVTCEKNPEALAVISSISKKKNAKLKRIDGEFSVSSIRQTLNGTKFDYIGDRQLRGLNTRLIGRHQAENAGLAVAMIEELVLRGEMITDEEIRKGISMTRWPGRLDIISKNPLIILDGSHNPDGVTTTVGVLKQLDLVPLTYVLGCMDDKDAGGMARALAPTAAGFVVTQVPFKRALKASALAEIVRAEFTGPAEVVQLPSAALQKATSAVVGRGVCVIGSLYLVGEVMRELKSLDWSRRTPAHKI